MAQRYVTGQLDGEKAEEFERHFFGCERCWEEVQRAMGLHSAFEGSRAEGRELEPRPTPSAAETLTTDGGRRAAHGGARPAPGRWRGRKGLLPLAAAAVVLVAAVGLWEALSDSGGADTTGVYRAPEGTVDVSAYTSGDLLVATWGSVQEAERYRVRVFTADGAVLYNRTAVDTTVTVMPEELSPPPGDSRLYWRIDALDPLGRVVARSGLRPVAQPPP